MIQRPRLGVLASLLLLSATPALAGPDVYGLGSGKDGALSVNGTTTAPSGDYRRLRSNVSAGATQLQMSGRTGWSAGDLVLVFQAAGFTPAPASGAQAPLALDGTPTGRWELARIASLSCSGVCLGSGGNDNLALDAPMGAAFASAHTQVIRVREYTDVTIAAGGVLQPPAWNGTTGGILAFLATGTVSNEGRIDVSGRGFRGGQLTNGSGNDGCTGLDQSAPNGARKGEGVVTSRFGSGNTGRGNVANGAGGGVCHNSGGGGGGNGTQGGQGGRTWVSDGARDVGGLGGAALEYSLLERITFGGGGGAGEQNNNRGSRGGNGGGALWLRAHALTGSGDVLADGESAPAVPQDANDAQGGGGAGGSIYLRVQETVACGQIRASGGKGGSLETPEPHGPGGGGGAGRILVQAHALEPSCALIAVAGDAGVHIGTTGEHGAQHGATPDNGAGIIGVILNPPGGFDRVPDAPTITAPSSGVPLSDDNPLVEGTAEPFSTVRIFLDDIEEGVVVADAAGEWSFSFPNALDDGDYELTATASNASGEGLPSLPVLLVIDTTPPDAPEITAPDGFTNDNQPLVVGTAEPGSTVRVFLDGALQGTSVTDGAGAWSFSLPSTLADGDYELTADATDDAGNTSGLSATRSFTVDTIPPDAPVLVAPADGALVNTATPTIRGEAEADSVITLYVDGVPAGSTTVAADGTFSLVPTLPFAEGESVLTLVATDRAGNAGDASVPSSVFVDTIPPVAPVIDAPADGSYHQAAPAVSGTAEAESVVQLFLNGAPAGQVTAGPDGAWTLSPGALVDGTYVATVHATDEAGNESGLSAPRTFMVDSVAPDAPVLVTPADGALVNTATPTVSGEAEPDSVVTLYVDGVPAGSTTVAPDGTFHLVPTTPFGEGENVITLVATDRAGNESDASAPSSVLVDSIPPDAPVILAPEEGVVTSETTPSLTGTAEVGSDVLLTLYDADDDELLVVSVGTDLAGQWSYTPDASEALTSGEYRLIAVAVDVAGNESAPAERTFEVDLVDGDDTTPPDTLITSGPDDPTSTTLAHFTFASTEPGSAFECALNDPDFTLPVPCDGGEHTYTDLDEGTWLFAVRAIDAAGNVDPTPALFEWRIAAGLPPAPVLTAPAPGLYADAEVRVEGEAQPGTLVRVYVDDTEVGSVAVGPDGTFGLDLAALADGEHEITARAESGFGLGPEASPVVIVIDTEAPAMPTLEEPQDGEHLNDPLPTLSGEAEPGSTVTVFVDDVAVGDAVADGDGRWTFTLTDPLDDDEHVIELVATDPAGNESAPSLPVIIVIDTDPPAAPVILAPVPGTTTVETTPTLTGTAEQGATVRIELRDAADDVLLTVELPTDLDGQWSYTLEPGEALSDGTFTLVAVAVDRAGNESPPASSGFTVDTTGGADTTPPDTIILSGPDPVTTERDAPFTFTSTEPGSTFECALGADPFAPCTSGHTVTQLAVGDYVFRVRATDPAGNTDPTPAVYAWRVVLAAPGVPVVTWPSSGDHTNNPAPVVTGTADPGSTVTLYVDGDPVASGTAASDGSFAIALPTLPDDGTYVIVVEASNEIGDASTGPIELVLDTVPPAVPELDEDLADSFTNEDPPTLSGSGEPGSTVTIVVDGDVVGEVEVDEDGRWAFTLPDPVGEGELEVEAHAEDAAGNVSAPTDPIVVTVDTTPPDAPILLSPADGAVTSELRPAVQGTAEPLSLVTVLLDGDLLGEVEADQDGGFGLTPSDDLAEGTYELESFATDAAGNESARARASFTVELEGEPVVPPDTVIESGPEDPSDSSDATFTFSCTKPSCTYECALDGGAFEPCESPHDYTGLDEGERTFRVRAIDEDGNVDPTPAVFTWEVRFPEPEAECGNGVREAGEGCDDGNLEDGDGCSAECLIEPGWACDEEEAEEASACWTIVDPKDPSDGAYVITGGGCACESSRPSGDAALFGLLALGLFGWRRRRGA